MLLWLYIKSYQAPCSVTQSYTAFELFCNGFMWLYFDEQIDVILLRSTILAQKQHCYHTKSVLTQKLPNDQLKDYYSSR